MANHPDQRREQLRSIVGDLDRELTAVTSEGKTGSAALEVLHGRWRALVDALDLGPSPETRTCPRCGATGMRMATRCGHCWVQLAPYVA
jgi:hypothetical protein